jgi:hypothetical protein
MNLGEDAIVFNPVFYTIGLIIFGSYDQKALK